MEKAKLNIFKSRRGKLITEIIFEDGKKITAPSELNLKDDSLSGEPVNVERVGGQVVKIDHEGNVLFSKERAPITNKESNDTISGILDTVHLDNIAYPAQAPYNFIPLNNQIVEGEPIPEFNRYDVGRHTGWINTFIEPITPIYIRDTSNNKELAYEIDAESKKQKYINSNFFSPCNKYSIPGSSLRGLIRNMVEIISFGKFGFLDDKQLYHRGLADNSKKLREDYKDRIGSYIRTNTSVKTNYIAKAGLLKQAGNRFYIEPLGNFYQEEIDDAKKLLKAIGHKYEHFTHYEIPGKGYLVIPGPMKNNRPWMIQIPTTKTGDIPIPQEDILAYRNDLFRHQDVPNLLEKVNTPCFYVTWKDLRNKPRVSFGHTFNFRLAYEKTVGEHLPDHLHLEKKIYKITSDRLKQIEVHYTFSQLEPHIKDKILQDLKQIEGRLFLLKDLEKNLNKILKDNHDKRELKDIILKCTEISDIAETIFGNEQYFAGRVFFEDAFLEEGNPDYHISITIPKILSTPKPTCFPHYLVQKIEDKDQLKNYYDDTSIRGNKLYWHKSDKNWKEETITYSLEKFNNFLRDYPHQEEEFQNALVIDDNQKRIINLTNLANLSEKLLNDVYDSIGKIETQHTKIEPITGGKFNGKIRFENLTEVELGALLFALDLPPGCCHKIGMGKPLGLGSIKISCELFLSKRTEQRYTSLSAEWNNTIEKEKTEEIDRLKQCFQDYVLEKINQKPIKDLWNTDRLRELKRMLDFNLGIQLEATGNTDYMDIDDFKKRKILPKPSKVS